MASWKIFLRPYRSLILPQIGVLATGEQVRRYTHASWFSPPSSLVILGNATNNALIKSGQGVTSMPSMTPRIWRWLNMISSSGCCVVDATYQYSDRLVDFCRQYYTNFA